MLGVANLPTYALGTLLIILFPGPSSLYTLSVAVRRGVRTAYGAAAGVFLGEMILMLLTAVGVGSLLKANPVAFAVVRFVGAGYLGWIALAMLRGAWAAWRTRKEAASSAVRSEAVRSEADATGTERPFRRSVLITLLNPKAILFFISFFAQFVDPAYPHPALSFALLALVYQSISLCYITALILGGTYLSAQFRRRKRLSAALTAGAGALFLGFAAKLATAGG
ncbi:leucine efflux protein LeuE [Streptomyces sp. NPDC090021]|uniref:leucine efflux protein LeuE n=1 Tax=Streptomyces sp. NPDC090021 TaxID=3365919 RepID=UPI0037F4A6AF